MSDKKHDCERQQGAYDSSRGDGKKGGAGNTEDGKDLYDEIAEGMKVFFKNLTREQVILGLAIVLTVFSVGMMAAVLSVRKEVIELRYETEDAVRVLSEQMEALSEAYGTGNYGYQEEGLLDTGDYEQEYYIPPEVEFGSRNAEAEHLLSHVVDDYCFEQIYNYFDDYNSFFFFEGEDGKKTQYLYDGIEEYMRSSIAGLAEKADGTYAITSYDGRTFSLIVERSDEGSRAVTILTDDTEGVFVTGRTFLESAECIEYNDGYCVMMSYDEEEWCGDCDGEDGHEHDNEGVQ